MKQKNLLKIILFGLFLCLGIGSSFGQSPGDLLITEFMPDPDNVEDSTGEYFEIYNTTGSPIDINGWTISDDGSNSHTIASSVVIPADGFAILAISSDPAGDGSVTPNYVYSSYTLSNGADEIVLTTPTSTEIARVNYNDGDEFGDGIAIELENINIPVNGAYTIIGSGTNAVAATDSLGAGSDKGSPGSAGNTLGISVGNTGPQITSISNSPSNVTSSDAVTVSADITDTDGIDPDSVDINWGTTSGNLTNTVAMSNTSGDTYEGTIPAQANGTNVFYEIEATDSNASPETSTSAEQSYTVTDPIASTIPYTIDFTTNDPFANNWTQQDLAGVTNSWSYTNGTGVQMNAYGPDDDNCEGDDWLISPAFNLDSYSNELLSYTLSLAFSGQSIETLYSTNYSGTGDPTVATWTQIESVSSAGTSSNLTNLQGVSGTSIYIAFRYQSANGSSCSRWTVESFSIDSSANPVVNFDSASSSETETDATFSVNIPVTLTNYGNTQVDLSVTVDGSSTAEVDDYTLNTSSLSFTTNDTMNISLSINDDADSDDETIVLNIAETSATGATISTSQHAVTITDDEVVLPNLVINEILGDIPTGGLDANGDGSATTNDDEFVELYNASGSDLDISGYILQDNASTRHTFPEGTIIPAGAIIVVFGGGEPTGIPCLTQVASTGALGLNNTGDTVTIFESDGTTQVTQAIYDGNNDEAEARNDDLVGNFVDHSSITGNPVNFSPGRDNTTNIPFSKTWTGGGVLTDWTDSDNWDTSSGPSSTSDNVWIPAGLGTSYPTISTTIDVNSITINSGASFIATASVNSSVTYQRELSTGLQWHLMSSPVSGENYNNDWVTANSIPSSSQDTDNRGISWYDNSSSDTDSDGAATGDSATGYWRYMAANDDTSFAVGRGYGVIRSGSGDIEFIGSGIYTSNQNFAVTQGENNFNLIGNPFTGFITLGTFYTTNSAVIGDTFHTWNGSSYTARLNNIIDSENQNFEIAPGQGFFVEASSAGNVTFEISDVSHQGTDTFQKNSGILSKINLFLSDGSNNRSAKLYYIEGTSVNYDPGYDGKLFGGVSHSFALYSHLISDNQGEKYQVQSLPNSDHENMVIPIGLIADAGKEITFTAEALNLPSGLKVFLEDRFTNTFTRLDEANSAYTIALTEKLDGVGRFYLHTKASALNIDEVQMENISMYTSNASTLRIVGLPQGKASIKLFNILGKQVLQTTFTSNGAKDITLPNVSAGIYIVQLKTATGQLNQKITLD